jgi:hypothetical protein
MATKVQYTASMTEKGQVSLTDSNGFERYRICNYRNGWQVMPIAVLRDPSRKVHPDPVAAAKSYFGTKMARIVEETWKAHEAEQEPAPSPAP